MLKRTSIVLVLTTALVFAYEPLGTVRATLMTSEEVAAANRSSYEHTQKKTGNGFVKALSAPFNAIARLFGGRKKHNKLQRLTEKDIAKFASTPADPVKITQV